MDWTHIIETFITTVGTVLSVYFANQARRHARDAANSMRPFRSGSEPDIRIDDKPRIKTHNDFMSSLDKIDDERDD